jgi:hypothetical protein
MSVARLTRWFAVFALALSCAVPAAAQQVRERITPDELIGLLKDRGMVGTRTEQGNVTVRRDNGTIVYIFSGQTLQAYYGVTGTSATLNSMNEWNKNKRFGRAYLDNDGDPCVELDYDLEGGVSDASLKVWIDTVNMIVGSFRTHISK